jgi:hypothetical protein
MSLNCVQKKLKYGLTCIKAYAFPLYKIFFRNRQILEPILINPSHFFAEVILDDSKDHLGGGSSTDRSRSTEKRGSVFGIPSFNQLRRMSDTSMRQVKERLRRMSTTGDAFKTVKNYKKNIIQIVFL